MKRSEGLLALLLGVALAACAVPRVESRHDQGFDFSGLRTFGFATNLPPPNVGPGDREDPKTVQALVIDAIRRELTAKGYREVSPGSGDFRVFFQAGTWARERMSNEIEGIEGHLSIRIIDPASGKAVWEAHGKETIYASMDTKQEIDKVVSRMLATFPPGA